MGAIGTIKNRPAYRGYSVRPASRIIHWLRTFERMMEKRRTRKALLELTDAQLKDIGLSRSQVHREASRHFWE